MKDMKLERVPSSIRTGSFFRELFEQSPVPTVVFDAEGKPMWLNDACVQLWNVTPGNIEYILQHHNILQDPILEKNGALPFLERAFQGEAVMLPAISYDPNELEGGQEARRRAVESFAYPVNNAEGRVQEVVLIYNDITDRKKAEGTLSLLAETGLLLAFSTDYRTTLRKIVELATRRFAGSCALHLLNEQGELQLEDLSHPEAATDEFKTSVERYLELPETHEDIRKTIAARAPTLRSVVKKDNTLEAFGFRSLLQVPLISGGRTLGLLTLIAPGSSYNDEDQQLVEELALRAAVAIQNSRQHMEAQMAIELRDDFLAIASHELRTPLAAMCLALQNLQVLHSRGAPSEDERFGKMLGIAVRQFDEQAHLVASLLETSRILSGAFSLRLKTVDLVTIIRETCDRLADQIQTAGCTLSLNLPATMPGHWDSDRLQIVIRNLLSNALKFGAGKPIQISASEAAERAIVCIEDQGPGISPQKLQTLFARYVRHAAPSDSSGFGLGLYLADQIVRAHQGAILVESELGEGSVFILQLPKSGPVAGFSQIG